MSGQASQTDQPATRERRRAILARAPLTARLSEAHRAVLLAASALKTCPADTVLFSAGQAARDVYLIGSGFVQLRVHLHTAAPAAEDDGHPDDATTLHWRLLGPGDIVADTELASLCAGETSRAARRNSAVVIGEPAEIVVLPQHALARVLQDDPAARKILAEDLVRGMEALIRVAGELALLKNFGKVRLARFLLELFDRMGRLRGGQMEIAQPFSHGDLAALLGLTRRSVFDDMTALQDFDAVDHDRSGRLVLRDRARLARIASLAQDDDKDLNAASWRTDIDTALAAGDTLRAYELAREALLYHPRDPSLRYAAVLAALRAGALEKAGELIGAFGYAARPANENEAALSARLLKERALASVDAETMRTLALQAAQAYWAAHEREGGSYTALNAAALFLAGGDTKQGEMAAARIAQAPVSRDGGYWPLATRAEACWLLGEAKAAADAMALANRAGDADGGKRATTRRQVRRIGAAIGRNAGSLLDAIPVRPVIACTVPDAACAKHIAALAAARVFVVADSRSAAAACAAFQDISGTEIVIAVPSDAGTAACLEHFPRHMADESATRPSPSGRRHACRHALGLAWLAAQEREADPPRLFDGPEDPHGWPDWAAGDALAEGQSVVLAQDGPPGLTEDVAAAERNAAGGLVLLRFGRLAEALDAAFRVLVRAERAGTPARVCLDVEALAGGLGDARLARLQPATRQGEVAATATAAAELALLRRGDIRLVSLGRVRSQRRFSRVQVWSVARAAPWS
jgi:CRP-like cAMP-binding protein